ncbi:MAG: DUF2339 domain-containing protein [Bacteroidota bacterium]
MQPDKLQELTERLNLLIRQHKENREEIVALKNELKALHAQNLSLPNKELHAAVSAQTETQTEVVPKPDKEATPPKPAPAPKPKRNLEAFVGGNLIAKVGIVILVLGLGYLVKYAIDNALLGPAMRVSMGFLSGVVLIGVAYWLKEKYRTYSGILLSGGLSILYFSAFSAYDFYELIPVGLAFGLMVVFTLFGVMMAYMYDVQAIGIFGLVGAYAVPPLLSDGTGEIQTMFAYMVMINLGVLSLAFRKDWRAMNLVAFIATWLIYAAWFSESYDAGKHFWIALGFGAAFFLLFYAVHLAYKVWKNTTFSVWDVILLLANAFLFFGFGYAVINHGLPSGDAATIVSLEHFLGLFTLINAVIHFGVAAFLYQRKLADKSLFFLVAGLVLTFLTIAIPVQLEGNWVTLLWIAEACLLLWIGQREGIQYYRALSVPLALLAIFSWIHDLANGYASSMFDTKPMGLMPIANIQFLTSVIVCGGLALMLYWMQRSTTSKNGEPLSAPSWTSKALGFLGISVLLTSFVGGFAEISHHFYEWVASTKTIVDGVDRYRYEIENFRSQWLMYYTLAYTSVLMLLNDRFWKDRNIARIAFIGGMIALLIFVFGGMPELGMLRMKYLRYTNEVFTRSSWMLNLRYVAYVFLAGSLYVLIQQFQKRFSTTPKLESAFFLTIHVVILMVLSFELMHIVVASSSASYSSVAHRVEQIGYSILWGAYGLFLMSLGFWKKKSYLRVGAIVLLGGTLIKVFAFDMAGSSVGSKVIVFVSLGVLLLITAFLYQRYKHIIEPEEEVLLQESLSESNE